MLVCTIRSGREISLSTQNKGILRERWALRIRECCQPILLRFWNKRPPDNDETYKLRLAVQIVTNLCFTATVLTTFTKSVLPYVPHWRDALTFIGSKMTKSGTLLRMMMTVQGSLSQIKTSLHSGLFPDGTGAKPLCVSWIINGFWQLFEICHARVISTGVTIARHGWHQHSW